MEMIWSNFVLLSALLHRRKISQYCLRFLKTKRQRYQRVELIDTFALCIALYTHFFHLSTLFLKFFENSCKSLIFFRLPLDKKEIKGYNKRK